MNLYKSNYSGYQLSRSKIAFYNSFYNLMKKHDFSDISVQDLINDSGYSRSSFYKNFDDKYDMLHVLMNDQAKMYIDACLFAFSNTKKIDNILVAQEQVALQAFHFIFKEKEFYTLLIKNMIPNFNKDNFFIIANNIYLENALYPIKENVPQLNLDLYSVGITGIFASFISFWVHNNFSYSVEYMAKQLTLFLENISHTDYMSIK